MYECISRWWCGLYWESLQLRQLQVAGHRPVVLDNLIFGHRQAVSADVPFYECDREKCGIYSSMPSACLSFSLAIATV